MLIDLIDDRILVNQSDFYVSSSGGVTPNTSNCHDMFVQNVFFVKICMIVESHSTLHEKGASQRFH